MFQSKITPLFIEIEPEGIYAIGEIIGKAKDSGLLEEIYPNDPRAARRARAAVVAYLGRAGIEPVGSKKSGKRICKTYLGKDLLDRDKIAEEVLPFLGPQRISSWRYMPSLILAALLFVGILFFPKADPVLRRIGHLKEAGDTAGIRELNRETSQRKETVSQEEKEEMLASNPVKGWTIKTNYYLVYPYAEQAAAAIAALNDDVVVIDSVVAVFPGLAFWVVIDENGDFRAVALGTKIAVKGIHGYITKVTQERLEYRTETGEQEHYYRKSLKFLGCNEQFGDKSIIYPRDEGNLDGLDVIFRKILGISKSEVATGQIVGFFPVFTSPQQVFELLTQVRDETVPLVVGFHRTVVNGDMPANVLLGRFNDITPFHLEWDTEQLTEMISYTGGSFQDTLIHLRLTPTKRDGKYILSAD